MVWSWQFGNVLPKNLLARVPQDWLRDDPWIWNMKWITVRCPHRWFSGRMLACHAGGPGSIPGRCKVFCTSPAIISECYWRIWCRILTGTWWFLSPAISDKSFDRNPATSLLIGIFKSIKSNNKNMSPRRGIEPRSPAWQAGILTTILSRITVWWFS